MNGNKPKLVFFSHICSPVFVTGAEKLLLLFARELTRRFQCLLVVPQEGAIAHRARELGIRVIVLEIPLSISLYTAVSTIAEDIEELKLQPSWGRLHALLNEERPDYVWVNTSVHPLPAIAAKSLGIPTIWALMEAIMGTPHRPAVAAYMAAHCDLVIGISHTTLQPFHAVPGAVKTFMLPPYLDREELQPGSWPYHRSRLRQQFGWTENHLVAGYLAANIYTNKGLEPFIQAMLPIAAAQARARFLIIGNPVEEHYYQSCQMQVQQSGYADRFVFLPFAEQIQHVFPVMDVVVIPSLMAEGFGMTALEGLVFGKGVVAFASGGLTEILSVTGNEAYMANTGDVAGLTERVNVLLSNDGLLKAVGERNAQMAQLVFGSASFRARLDEMILQLPERPLDIRNSIWRGSGPTVFLVEKGIKRPFVSEKAFLQRGYVFEEVTSVPDEHLLQFPSGTPLQEIGTRRRVIRKRRKKTQTRSHKRRHTAKERRRPAQKRSRKKGKNSISYRKRR